MAGRVSGAYAIGNDVAALQPSIDFAAASFRQAVAPQKHSAGRHFSLHAPFGKPHILLESRGGLQIQRSCIH